MIGNTSSSASSSSSSTKSRGKIPSPQPKTNEAPGLPTADSPNAPANAGDPSKSTPFKHTRLPASPHHPPPTSAEFWDIDLYLNRFIPAPRLHLLPSFLSRFLGYRRPDQIQHPIPLPLSALSTFFGCWISIVVTVWIFSLFPSLSDVEVNPLIIASLGANAVLEFTALSSPLAQPRALLLSSPLAAIIGVSISKGFMSLNHDPMESAGTESGNARYEELEWLAGALAVSISAFVMVVTKTVHPPAGATALIAVVTPEGRGLGWWLVLLVFVGSAFIGIVGLLINNLLTCRRWPVFWWTEHPLKAPPEDDEEMGGGGGAGGGGGGGKAGDSGDDIVGQQDMEIKPHDGQDSLEKDKMREQEENERELNGGQGLGKTTGGGERRPSTASNRRSSIGRRQSLSRRLSIGTRLSRVKSDGEVRDEQDPQGLQREATEELDGHFILEQALHIPRHLEVSYEEMAVLRGLRERLHKGGKVIMEEGGGEPPEVVGRRKSRGKEVR